MSQTLDQAVAHLMAALKTLSGLVPHDTTSGPLLQPYTPQATSIAFVTPPPNLAGPGALTVVRAVVLDQQGLPLTVQPAVALASVDTSVMTLTTTLGTTTLTGVALGSTQVRASVAGLADALLSVTVGGVATLNHLTLTISKASVGQAEAAPTLTLHAWADAAGTVAYTAALTPAPAYSASASNVASVNTSTGVITLQGPGTDVLNVTAGGKTATVTLTVTPAPVITSVTPNTITPGTTALAFTVNGTNIPADAVLWINHAGADIAVTLADYTRVSATQITGHMTAPGNATVPGAGTFQVTSATAGPSNYYPLTVGAASPVLSSISPASLAQGQTSDLVLTGLRYTADCSVGVAGTGVVVNTRAAAAAVPTGGPFDSATNAIAAPRDFTNAAWGHDGVTTAAAAAAGPSGVAGGATKIVESTALAVRSLYQTIMTVAGQTTAIEMELKAVERTFARIGSYDSPGGPVWWLNLTTGAITTPPPGDAIPTVVSLGNGWWRIKWMHVTTTGGVQNLIYISPTTGNGVDSYQGDGTSGILIGGLQAEKNTAAPTFDMFTPGSPAVTASPSIDSATQITANVTAAAGAALGNHAVTVHSASNGDSGAVQLGVTAPLYDSTVYDAVTGAGLFGFIGAPLVWDSAKRYTSDYNSANPTDLNSFRGNIRSGISTHGSDQTKWGKGPNGSRYSDGRNVDLKTWDNVNTYPNGDPTWLTTIPGDNVPITGATPELIAYLSDQSKSCFSGWLVLRRKYDTNFTLVGDPTDPYAIAFNENTRPYLNAFTLAQAVTASPTAQTVLVTNIGKLNKNSTALRIDSGLPTQEYIGDNYLWPGVNDFNIVDSTHISAIFSQNHASGAVVDVMYRGQSRAFKAGPGVYWNPGEGRLEATNGSGQGGNYVTYLPTNDGQAGCDNIGTEFSDGAWYDYAMWYEQFIGQNGNYWIGVTPYRRKVGDARYTRIGLRHTEDRLTTSATALLVYNFGLNYNQSRGTALYHHEWAIALFSEATAGTDPGGILAYEATLTPDVCSAAFVSKTTNTATFTISSARFAKFIRPVVDGIEITAQEFAYPREYADRATSTRNAFQFNRIVTGLAAGSHTISFNIYNGNKSASVNTGNSTVVI